MAPNTRGTRKRGKGEDAGGKERKGSKKTKRRGKKYFGAHVSIQGKVFLDTSGVCLEQNITQNCALVLQGGSGKLWSPVQRWGATASPCFWAPSAHGRDLLWTRRLQPSFRSSAPYMR